MAALDKTPHQRVRLLRLGTTYIIMLEECVSKEIYYREVKQRVFLDSRAWIPAINFRDPDKRVEEVFTIFERVDLTKEEEEERVGLHTQV